MLYELGDVLVGTKQASRVYSRTIETSIIIFIKEHIMVPTSEVLFFGLHVGFQDDEDIVEKIFSGKELAFTYRESSPDELYGLEKKRLYHLRCTSEDKPVFVLHDHRIKNIKHPKNKTLPYI